MTRFIIYGCVKIPDGRIGRVRKKVGNKYKVRVRRRTSSTHQFLYFERHQLKAVACPKKWMSPEGYKRYLQKTLLKMKKRN
ncbi:MAG TPA: hypothetical protein VMR37_00335 [Rhabdochlamydiaceae bacterium]|nr:hypothetical protein [Rhabdochlamydiaceae bacterium]